MCFLTHTWWGLLDKKKEQKQKKSRMVFYDYYMTSHQAHNKYTHFLKVIFIVSLHCIFVPLLDLNMKTTAWCTIFFNTTDWINVKVYCLEFETIFWLSYAFHITWNEWKKSKLSFWTNLYNISTNQLSCLKLCWRMRYIKQSLCRFELPSLALRMSSATHVLYESIITNMTPHCIRRLVLHHFLSS